MSSKIQFGENALQALDLMENTRKSLFITGKAGTGKSTLLNHFRLKTKKNHAVLAPTGIAAVNIGGETIHSFFGFKPNINPSHAKEVARNSKKEDLFRNLEMIIIDEISMVRADLLDCVDIFLKTILGLNAPFGGIQMVFIGDLFQLPPVLTNEEKGAFEQIYPSAYFFDSKVMQEVYGSLMGDFEKVELTEIYRQNDDKFINILNNIRTQNLEVEDLQTLNQRCSRELLSKTDESYIYISTTNKIVNDINSINLKSKKTREYTLEGILEGEFDEKILPTELELTLKIGARVMFLNNDSMGRWTNGTLGTVLAVEGIDEEEPVVKVQIDGGAKINVEQFTWSNYQSTLNEETGKIERVEIGSFTQIPLKLAWAITIHKSQGKTFEKVIIDLGFGAFAHGQTYVALSRCKSLEGIVLKRPIRSSDIILDRRVLDFLY